VSVSVADLVASLRVAADTKGVQDFHKELKATAATSSGKLQAGLKIGANVVAALGAAALAAAGSLIYLTGKVTEQANEMAKGARAAGIEAEEFQRLSHASKLAGTDTDKLVKGVRRLNTEVEKAAQGRGTPDFANAIAELGLTLTDLEGKTASEQLGIFADAMAGIENPARKSALAALIFGEKVGPDFASLMAEGSEGINSLMGNLDNVFTDEQLAQAEQYQDSMTELGDRVDQAKTEIAFALVPALLEATDGMEGWIGENEDFIKQDLPNAMGEIVEAVVEVVKFFGEAAAETKVLSMQLKQLEEDTGAFSTAWALLTAPFRAVQTVIEETASAISAIVQKIAEVVGFSKELEAFAAKFGFGPETQRVERGAGTAFLSEGGKQGEISRKSSTKTSPAELEAIIGNPNVTARDREAAKRHLPEAYKRAADELTTAVNFATGRAVRQGQLDAEARAGRVKRARRAASKSSSKGGGGKAKKEASLEDLINAATGDGTIDSDLPLDEIAKRAPTVVVQITNNNITLSVAPNFPSVHEALAAAEKTSDLVVKTIQDVFDQTGQRIAPVLLR
jgi:hypothetical protein